MVFWTFYPFYREKFYYTLLPVSGGALWSALEHSSRIDLLDSVHLRRLGDGVLVGILRIALRALLDGQYGEAILQRSLHRGGRQCHLLHLLRYRRRCQCLDARGHEAERMSRLAGVLRGAMRVDARVKLELATKDEHEVAGNGIMLLGALLSDGERALHRVLLQATEERNTIDLGRVDVALRLGTCLELAEQELDERVGDLVTVLGGLPRVVHTRRREVLEADVLVLRMLHPVLERAVDLVHHVIEAVAQGTHLRMLALRLRSTRTERLGGKGLGSSLGSHCLLDSEKLRF